MDEKKHTRRPHYSGSYPKRFSEKYKERDPEKYADTVEKVIRKGSTPAGMHIPIMADEILSVLKIRPGETGLDCTLGYGGHSSKMAAALEGKGHLFALDVDPVEIEKTKERMVKKGFGPDIFTAVRTNFRNIDLVAKEHGPFDFLLADLGVSSMQIDDPSRGFSYKTDGPLDLRLDPSSGRPASGLLPLMSGEDLYGMLLENADEPFAKEISSAIREACRKRRAPETTKELKEIVEKALEKPLRSLSPDERQDALKRSLARTFQAIRIDVNSEFEVLEEFLTKLPGVLSEHGRAAILTFHSGEDRLVKDHFRAGLRDGLYSEVSKDVVRAGTEECFRNPRSRSAKLRYALK